MQEITKKSSVPYVGFCVPDSMTKNHAGPKQKPKSPPEGRNERTKKYPLPGMGRRYVVGLALCLDFRGDDLKACDFQPFGPFDVCGLCSLDADL